MRTMALVMTRSHLRGGLAFVVLAIVLVLGAAGTRHETASAGAPCATPAVTGGTYAVFYGAPVVIPDNDAGGVSACMTIGAGQPITDLNVGLVIEHRWPGDLIITLTHEGTGTIVTLVDRPGVPTDGLGCGEEGNDMSVVLDDSAVSSVEATCLAATPTISGTLRPNGQLSGFIDENLSGTWTLHMRDAAIGDTGGLNAWSLIAGGGGSGAGDVNCSGGVNSIDATLVLQLIAELTGSLPCQANADVNGSGGVNSVDATLILQFVAGLIDSLPV